MLSPILQSPHTPRNRAVPLRKYSSSSKFDAQAGRVQSSCPKCKGLLEKRLSVVVRIELKITNGNDDPNRHCARTNAASVAMRPVGDNLPSVKSDHRHMHSHKVVARSVRRDVVIRTSIPTCSRFIRRTTRRSRIAHVEKCSSVIVGTAIQDASV